MIEPLKKVLCNGHKAKIEDTQGGSNSGDIQRHPQDAFGRYEPG